MSKKEMSTKVKSSADGVQWDLGIFYYGVDDPQLERDFQKACSFAKDFEDRYRGKVNSTNPLTDVELADAIKQYESILELAAKPCIYAHLVHACKSDEPKNGALVQRTREMSTQIRKHLLFFELEWLELDDAVAGQRIHSDALAQYRNYLIVERLFRPHRLSEAEEKLSDLKANTGARAFQRLFKETTSSITVSIDLDGDVESKSVQETLAMLYSPNRAARIAAAKGLSQSLKENSHLLTYIFNTLTSDKKAEDDLRHYSSPAENRHLSNQIDAETVDALMKACEDNFSLVHRYYRLKQELLGLDQLNDFDRYAPIFEEQPNCEWARCREIVSAAYHDFSPVAGQIINRFFEENWIDAELRSGKVGGAFSAGCVPSAHPYILLNYTDRLRDVTTTAHELGHGLHQYLSRDVGYLQMSTPLTTAETASVFGEMLVFHRLMSEYQDNPKIRLSLLCGKIEDAFATVFRQVVMTRFEEKLHHSRASEGELTAERIGELWMETNEPMHGSTVQLSPDYSYWWSYIPHFVQSPFYCYAYAFGELLVFSLYRKYKQQGEPFVSKYLDLLSAGGSDSPKNLLAKMDIDVTDPTFWQEGLDLLEEMLVQAETLAKEIS